MNTITLMQIVLASQVCVILTVQPEFVHDAHRDCDDITSFRCDDTQCIDVRGMCNGISECRNGRDEGIPVCGCQSWEFQCNDTHCIDLNRRCDIHPDCENQKDEADCDTYLCPLTHVKCHNGKCIPRDLQCDYKDDCGDNSDEEACPYYGCYPTQWECDNTQCIMNPYLCDGYPDCYDGSDERNCDSHVMCANHLYVSKNHSCDGWVDCVGSQDDELNCPCDTSVDLRCKNNRCVRQANVCDGVCDCGNTCEDELNCGAVPCMQPDRFICRKTHRCIQSQYVCDGVNDCKDSKSGHDEELCLLPGETCHQSVQCSDGKCIQYDMDMATQIATCDHILDCVHGEDEKNCAFLPCRDDRPHRCDNGQCIRPDQLCDTHIDCHDMSDELHCEHHACAAGYVKCPGTGQCLRQDKLCDYVRDCMDASDEHNCDRRPCREDQFTCKSGQCIAGDNKCIAGKNDSDVEGCVDESHLLDCKDFQCPHGFYKCRNSHCINASYVCDDVVDCKATYTDESNCSRARPCPYDVGEELILDFMSANKPKCWCFDLEMNCERLGFHEIPDMTLEPMTKLRFGGNYLNYSLSPDLFEPYSHFTYLDISNNSLSFVGMRYFVALWRLSTLNLADNQLKEIVNGTFLGLGKLHTLYLDGNGIEVLQPYSFQGLSSLTVLDLSHQRIQILPINAFSGLRSLRNLDLSHNQINMVSDGVFNGLTTLMILDMSHNLITNIGDNVFNGLLSLELLKTDEFRFCCLAPSVDDCWPKPDEFSSCEDLMSNSILRICIWVLGLLSLLGNTLVIYWRLRDTRDSKVHSFLITNLAIGDLLMGVYLLIIASVDLHYRGIYIIYDLFWRESGLCNFAGFLSTYSSELSVLTLTVITIDRFISIIFPFRLKRMSMRDARIVMVTLWAIVFALAAIPLANISYFDNFYGRSGVCLALHITPEKPNGWQYSVFVFLALNLFSFVVIFLSYLWMFVIARRTRAAARSPQMKTDRAMARRMTLIVLTDFSCWIPIIGLGIASLCGANIPPQVFAWIAVFVLPLNSAINPILYTISTASFLGHARRRAFKFRKSFMSSFSPTDNTKTTVASAIGDRGSPGNEWARPICKHAKRNKSKDAMFMYSMNGPINKDHKRGCYRYEKRRMTPNDSSTSEYTRSDMLCGYESDQ